MMIHEVHLNHQKDKRPMIDICARLIPLGPSRINMGRDDHKGKSECILGMEQEGGQVTRSLSGPESVPPPGCH